MSIIRLFRSVRRGLARLDWSSHQRILAEARWRLRKKRGVVTPVLTRQGVFTLNPDDCVISFSLFWKREFQLETTERVLSFLRRERMLPPKGQGVVVDVGANIGVISIGMLVNGEFSSAIGVEPDPANFSLLSRNVLANRLQSRFSAIQAAASDGEGELRFDASSGNFGDHWVVSEGKNLEQHIRVKALKLDSIVRGAGMKLEDVSLVWIDVQGHESAVFSGGSELFSHSVPVVAEVCPHAIIRGGLSVADYCKTAAQYWSSFWVWRRSNRFVRYPIGGLPKFCEELGTEGEYDDVIFTKA